MVVQCTYDENAQSDAIGTKEDGTMFRSREGMPFDRTKHGQYGVIVA